MKSLAIQHLPDDHYNVGLALFAEKKHELAYTHFLLGMKQECHLPIIELSDEAGLLRISVLDALEECARVRKINLSEKMVSSSSSSSSFFSSFWSMATRIFVRASINDLPKQPYTEQLCLKIALEYYIAKQYHDAIDMFSIAMLLGRMSFLMDAENNFEKYFILRSHVYFISGDIAASKKDLAFLVGFFRANKNKNKKKSSKDEIIAFSKLITTINKTSFENMPALINEIVSLEFIRKLTSEQIETLIQACSQFCINQSYSEEVTPKKEKIIKKKNKVTKIILPEIKVDEKKEEKAEINMAPRALFNAEKKPPLIEKKEFNKCHFIHELQRYTLSHTENCFSAEQFYIDIIEKNQPECVAFSVGGGPRDFYRRTTQAKKDIDIIVIGSGLKIARLFEEKGFAVEIYHEPKHFLLIVKKIPETKEILSSLPPSAQIIIKETLLDLKQDALLRDFTINTLYWRNQILYAPFAEAINDFEKKLIRVVPQEKKSGELLSDPEISFNADPIRMLRVITFFYKLPDFSFTPDILPALRKCAHQLANVPPNSMQNYLEKISFYQKMSNRELDLLFIVVDFLPKAIALKWKEMLSVLNENSLSSPSALNLF